MATSRFNFPVPKSVLLLGVLVIGLFATSAVEAAQPPALKVFKVGRRLLEGRPMAICIIEGKWADGGNLIYKAWDTCKKMRVRTVSYEEYKDAPSLGNDAEYGVTDIPKGSEVLEFENGVSKTLMFRDRKGIQREILSGD